MEQTDWTKVSIPLSLSQNKEFPPHAREKNKNARRNSALSGKSAHSAELRLVFSAVASGVHAIQRSLLCAD
jgi:hypothetical protein